MHENRESVFVLERGTERKNIGQMMKNVRKRKTAEICGGKTLKNLTYVYCSPEENLGKVNTGKSPSHFPIFSHEF